MHGDVMLTDVIDSLALVWSEIDEMPSVAREQIHLWALDLSALDFAANKNLLQQAEYARARRIIDRQKRQLYLGGRIGLRVLLSRYTGIENIDLRFGYGERGKPALLNKSADGEITFNYTLSGDKVLYAVSRDRQVGVDMEVLPRQINAEMMAERKLTPCEQRAWKRLPAALHNDSMLCCWTRKEAYGKAIGVGIRYRLNEVNLFHGLDNCRWQTRLAGLFTESADDAVASAAMPQWLEGVQLQLPFAALASLTYEIERPDSNRPSVLSARLQID